MPAYSFQLQFCPFVEDGSKTHTIRGKRNLRPRVGQTFFGYYAMRTKHCRKLVEAPLVNVEDVVINVGDGRIWIAEQELDSGECNQLAFRDGFRSSGWSRSHEEMMRFWKAKHAGVQVFSGDVIHWDYDRRVRKSASQIN